MANKRKVTLMLAFGLPAEDASCQQTQTQTCSNCRRGFCHAGVRPGQNCQSELNKLSVDCTILSSAWQTIPAVRGMLEAQNRCCKWNCAVPLCQTQDSAGCEDASNKEHSEKIHGLTGVRCVKTTPICGNG